MERKITIAIDGYSSCGKSTLAKDLARRLHYRYIDTGAMYRAVTLHFMRNHVDIYDYEQVVKALDQIHIDFHVNEETRKQETYLNDESVEKAIREPMVSDKVSQVSTIKEVRNFLVLQQKKMGKRKGIVMDGRDIGTVVFPDAELKIFMTSDEDVRVERRYIELKELGIETTMEQVRDNIRKRDYIDTHREESPLKKAEDAIEINNTTLTTEEQLALVCELVAEILSHSDNIE